MWLPWRSELVWKAEFTRTAGLAALSSWSTWSTVCLWFFCISSPPRRISISVVQSGVLYDRVCQFCVDCHANFLTRGSRSIPRTASMRFYGLRARHLPIAGVHPVVQIFDGVRWSEHQVVIHVSALPRLDLSCHCSRKGPALRASSSRRLRYEVR